MLIKKIKQDYYVKAYKEILNIIHEVIENQDYNNVTIYLYSGSKPVIISREDNRNKILSMVNEIDALLSILKYSKRTYLVDTMKDLFYTNCIEYSNLVDLIFNNMITGIRYKKKYIQLKHMDIISTFYDIINNGSFVLELN